MTALLLANFEVFSDPYRQYIVSFPIIEFMGFPSPVTNFADHRLNKSIYAKVTNMYRSGGGGV
jgi:hypothetical protein